MEKMKPCKACGQEIAKSAKVCPHCGAKNKKPPVGCLVVLILFLLVGACGAMGSDTDTTLPVESAPPASTAGSVKATVPTEPPVPETTAPLGTRENPYMPGMYKVGSDLPAGEYLFLAVTDAEAYVCVSSDSNQDDILENELFGYTFFVTVEDGEYLEATRCAFVFADDVVLNINDDGSFGEGMYRAGRDIPAGEYKLTSDDGMGYYCIYNDTNAPFDIVSNDLFDSSAYVTVKDGQYLVLSRCTAVPAK